MQKIKTFADIRGIISDEICDIRNGKSDPKRSSNISALAGKWIQSVRTELDFVRITKKITPSAKAALGWQG